LRRLTQPERLLLQDSKGLIRTYLNGRELGRLLNATDGEGWLKTRDKAMLELMARAGLRVSEIVTLRMKDVTIRPRSGDVLVRHGKGMKERDIPLGRQTRRALAFYLSVRPEQIGEYIFVSRTYKSANIFLSVEPINPYRRVTSSGWYKRSSQKFIFQLPPAERKPHSQTYERLCRCHPLDHPRLQR
jgi:integrase